MLIKNKTVIMQLSLLSLGIILMVMGVYRNELTDIMQKAVVVCLSCIGIG